MRNHPVWIELSRSNLTHNWCSIQKVVGNKITIIPMLKSNAYGHGAKEIGKIIEELGAKIIGVTSLREAIELREEDIHTPILIADYVESENIEAVLSLKNIDLTISDPAMFPQIEKIAKKLKKKINVHINIDTGMHREGVWPLETAVKIVSKIMQSAYVKLEGLFTHFATAGDKDTSFVQHQLSIFNKCLDNIETLGIPLPKYVHAAEGAGVMRFPQMYNKDPRKRFTSVRPGNIIYGLPPGDGFPFLFPLKPVLFALKAKLAGVKTIQEGETVGYGRTWKAKKTTRIGIVTSGYTDGYRRSLANKGYMLVHGQRCPIAGLISMNQTVLQFPDKGTFALGDEVVIIGKQGKNEITLQELVTQMGIPWYEYVISLPATRLPRIVIDK